MTNTIDMQQQQELITINIPQDEIRVLGQVKWFNNTRGYGFITATSGDHINEDIFVHQNNLITYNKNVYRVLNKGEYVEYVISPLENNKQYNFHATNVTGPGAHRLMCETNPQRKRTHINNT
jgi:cold shock CspA family protein